MATVQIFTLAEPGHVFPLLKIARTLARRGHDVGFVGPPEMGALVAPHGTRFVEAFHAAAPGPLVAELSRAAGAEQRRLRRRLFERLLRIYDHDYLLAELERLGPADIWLVDTYQQHVSLAATALGTAALQVNCILPADRAANVPPCSSGRVPRHTAVSRLRIAGDWALMLAARRALGRLAAAFGPPGVHQASVRLRRLARQCGVSARRLRRATTFSPTLDVDELVLCPRAFDLPRPRPPWRRYVEPSIDFERTAPPLPRAAVPDPDRPLALCALGGMAHFWGGRDGLLRRLLDAFDLLDGWQAVVLAGPGADPGGRLPANVTLLDRGPQLELLARADVAVVHGGFGTIKECIWHGVPVLVLPMSTKRDHPGNAARIVYHGLGAAADPGSIGAAELAALIPALAADKGIRSRLLRMSDRFRRAEDEQPGVAAIEERLALSADVGASAATTAMPAP